MVSEQEVLDALKGVTDPHTGKDVADEFVQDLRVDGDEVTFVMRPPEGEDHCPRYVPLSVDVKRRVKAVPGVTKVNARLTCHMQSRAVNQALEMMDQEDAP